MERAKIGLIQRASDCTEEEAEMGLEAAEGNVHEAVELIQLLRREIVVIKIRLYGRRRVKTQGLLLLLANGLKGSILRLETLITHAQEELPSELDIDWQAFHRTLDQLRDELRINKKLSYELRDHLMQGLRAGEINRLYRQLREGQKESVVEALRDLLIERIGEELEIELAYDLLTRFQYDAGDGEGEVSVEGPDREDAGEDDREVAPQKESELNIYLKTEPVIDPVGGRTAGDIEIGDQIMVRLIDDREVGRYLTHLLGGIREDSRVPIRAEVREKERLPSGRCQIVVCFGPGIWGRFCSESELKLKSLAADERELEGNGLDEGEDSTGVEVYVAGAVLLVLLSIFLWFLGTR